MFVPAEKTVEQNQFAMNDEVNDGEISITFAKRRARTLRRKKLVQRTRPTPLAKRTKRPASGFVKRKTGVAAKYIAIGRSRLKRVKSR
jgi:hypothetical protein